MRSILVFLICVIAFICVSCQDEPYESGNADCEMAIANTAQAALNFLSANDDNYAQLCIAYRNALLAQILACGDSDGSLQIAIASLGNCNNACDEATEAAVSAQIAYENAITDNYSILCNAYIVALQNQIIECGDEDGSIQAIIDDLGDCIPASSSAEIYITGLFDGIPIVMVTGTSDNYLPGIGFGFTSLNDGDGNCRIGYKGTVASSLPFNELPIGSIGFDYFYEGNCNYTNESSIFNSIFSNGNYEALEEEGNLEQGMHFEYYPNGFEDVWYTSAIGDQSGSQFTVINSESANYTSTDGIEIYRQIIEGTFNCTIYDTSIDSIQVTNGTFRVIVSQYFD